MSDDTKGLRKIQRALKNQEARLSALESREESESSNTISDSDRLSFLGDYLLRARQEALQDKTALTQLTYIKVAIFAVMAAFLRSPTAAIGVALLPIVLYSLDYLHRTRFNEIFHRWHHCADVVIPSIERLAPGLLMPSEGNGPPADIQVAGACEVPSPPEPPAWFEAEISLGARQGKFERNEGLVRALMTGLSTVGTVPVAGAFADSRVTALAGHGAAISVVWCGLLLLMYGLLFFRKGYGTTHGARWTMPLVITLCGLAMLVCGEQVVGLYEQVLGLSSPPATP